MGNVRAGDIRQFVIDGREFDPAPGTSWTLKPGGLENESAITGNGQLHTTQKRVVAGFSDVSVSVDPEREDLQFLTDLKNAGRAVPVTVTLVGGDTYAGSLVVDGAVELPTGEGVVKLMLSGARLEKI